MDKRLIINVRALVCAHSSIKSKDTLIIHKTVYLMSTPTENLVLFEDPVAVNALRQLFTSYESGLLRGDQFAARLDALGWSSTSESERLLRSDRFTFSALCTALKRGHANLPASFGIPSILAVHLHEQASRNDMPPHDVPGARGNLRRDLIDTGATYLMRPFAFAESTVNGIPVTARNVRRETARAVLTRMEAGTLTPSNGSVELETIGFLPSAIPELARAISNYATCGRMDYTKALAGIDTFLTLQQEAETGLSGSGLHTRVARSPTKTSSPVTSRVAEPAQIPTMRGEIRKSGLSYPPPNIDPIYKSQVSNLL